MKVRARGATLVEVMVATVIITVGMLGFVGSFAAMSKGIQRSKTRTLSATPLALEKLEVLKKISYTRLLVSTATAAAPEAGMGGFLYDTAAYPPESVTLGGVTFTRRVLVEKVQDVGGAFTALSPTGADTGIKRVTAHTIWQEDGVWQRYTASTLHSNPSLTLLATQLLGAVTASGGGVLADAQVTALESPTFTDLSDSAGSYGFLVTAGSYTLRASKHGYYPAYSSRLNAPYGSEITQDFTLIPIGTGTATGTVWFSTTPLISQVVGSTVSALGWSQEYVEVFNPTTYSWTASNLGLRFQRPADAAKKTILITYTNPSIASGGFYLFANTSPVVAAGASRAADAVWSDANAIVDFPYFVTQRNIIPTSDQGGEGGGALELYRVSDVAVMDRIGWDRNNGGQSAPFFETDGLNEGIGLQVGERYYRKSSTDGPSTAFGPAYDSGDNTTDWSSEQDPLDDPPRNTTTGTLPIIAGVPAIGAVVSADDGLSSPLTLASAGSPPYAAFTLTSIATGTWTVRATSGTLHLAVSTVVITQNATTLVPNAATAPAWPSTGYDVARLSSTITQGFISGTVRKGDLTLLSGIPIKAGGVTATTAANGTYTLTVDTGTHTVDGNPASAAGYNSLYVSQSSAGWIVATGRVTAGVDFTLPQGGSIRGRITTNGSDPLPDVPILALQEGVERGSALSDATGYFTITNLSTGSYWAVPQTDLGESVTPSSKSVSMTSAGQQVWTATFTWSGAMGTITGTVKKSGTSIATGALIVATTGTISGTDNPPTNNSTLRTGGVLYYVTSSHPDGTYSLAVRGGAGTYRVYGWYSVSATSTTKTSGTTTVTAGGSSTVNLAW